MLERIPLYHLCSIPTPEGREQNTVQLVILRRYVATWCNEMYNFSWNEQERGEMVEDEFGNSSDYMCTVLTGLYRWRASERGLLRVTQTIESDGKEMEVGEDGTDLCRAKSHHISGDSKFQGRGSGRIGFSKTTGWIIAICIVLGDLALKICCRLTG